jgi:hypothetical protein
MLAAIAPYLISGLGVAVGAILALWYMNKYNKLKGTHDLLKSDHEALKDSDVKMAKDHTSQVERMTAELEGLREREKTNGARIRELLATCNDPVALNDELNGMFPLPKEGGTDVPPVP